jgi:hypothetical protein
MIFKTNWYKHLLILAGFLLLTVQLLGAITWEKLYSKKSSDCFRDVREVISGGYILAGYTADFSPNDTDGLVVRMNVNGDTLWTFVYNGPLSREDAFYKVVPSIDGGFILCGHSRSFGNIDDALFLKLDSSGILQWVKNWGGIGIDRAQDIVELADGKLVACGYTASPPAQYYDAFILKMDKNGGILWNKIHGQSTYEDANSLKVLSDGGFILGGQSNNQFYLLRTNSIGDSIWSKTFGSLGVDNIECLNFAQGGQGFVLAGSSNGPGAVGGYDAYLIKTDTSGTPLWTKTFGDTLNEDFHKVELTSDGGYVLFGTGSQGIWANPNMWILKTDSGGVESWRNYFGGNLHDHGYCGLQTQDGGYIVAGHSRSFAFDLFLEDAYVVKLNSSGIVTNNLSYTTVTKFLAPVDSICPSSAVTLSLEVANFSDKTINGIPVTVEITGPIPQILNQTINSTFVRNQFFAFNLSSTMNLSLPGTYYIHCFTGNLQDVIPSHNFLDTIITVFTSSAPITTDGKHCGPGVVTLSAVSNETIRWYNVSTGGVLINTGPTYITPFLNNSTTYYVEAGGTCPSIRKLVNANIVSSLPDPQVTDGSACGEGMVILSASSPDTLKWYESPVSSNVLIVGDSLETPFITSDTIFYVQAVDNNCISNRVPVLASIDSLPNDPVITNAAICEGGTAILNASSVDLITWFLSPNDSNLIGVGNNFTTPPLFTSAVFYAQAYNGICYGNFVPAMVTVNALPSLNLGPDTIFDPNPVLLDAGSGFSSYLWSTGDTTQTIMAELIGNYCVDVVDSNSCTATDCVYKEFDNGVEKNVITKKFDVFPNPTNGLLTIKSRSSEYKLSIIDIAGEVVYESFLTKSNEVFDITFLSPGIYCIRFSNAKNIATEKLIIN